MIHRVPQKILGIYRIIFGISLVETYVNLLKMFKILF